MRYTCLTDTIKLKAQQTFLQPMPQYQPFAISRFHLNVSEFLLLWQLDKTLLWMLFKLCTSPQFEVWLVSCHPHHKIGLRQRMRAQIHDSFARYSLPSVPTSSLIRTVQGLFKWLNTHLFTNGHMLLQMTSHNMHNIVINYS